MKRAALWLGLLIVVGGVLAAFYYYQQQSAPPGLPPPALEAPAPEPKEAPRIRHPIPETKREVEAPEPKPLPALDKSDEALQRTLADLLGRESVQVFFHLEDIVRRLVVTIDNLPRKELPMRYRPLKPVAGKFLTRGKDAALSIAADNYGRYAPYVRLAEAVDTKKLVAVYVHFYTLFQQAYEDIGYPSGYFNDRLVEVIDDLLAAPDIQAPIRLIQPKVMYQFADPALEARSAGQKILIRVGSDNAARLKAKLRELRTELTGQAAKTSVTQ